MSLATILENLSNDQIIQLASESRNWGEVVPQYQVPLWYLFTKPDFHFEHLIQIPNHVSKLLTINWDATLLEGLYQGASFAWYFVRLQYSEELFADHRALRDRLCQCDWDQAPTSGPDAGYSLGWAILLKDVIPMLLFHNAFPRAADHAIHRCDWNRKGPHEWADVTFAWMYEERWAFRTHSLMRYNRPKLMKCDWTVAPKAGPKQSMTLGWVLSRSFRSTDINQQVFDKLSGCDWEYAPNQGRHVTIPWNIVSRLKINGQFEDWKISFLLNCNWDFVPNSVERADHYSRSIAWHLVDSPSLFCALIKVPELENKLLESNWDATNLANAITLLLIRSDETLKWLQTNPRAQAKFARCNWDLIREVRNQEDKRKSLLNILLDQDYCETQEFLLTNGYMLERLCEYDMDQAFCREHSKPLGKILAQYYVGMKGYEFMPMLVSKHPYILEVGLRNQEPIFQEEKINQAFLEFSVLMDCCMQLYDQPLLKDLRKPLFDAHIAGYFPHLRHHSLIPFLLKKWEEWEQKYTRTWETTFAMLVTYRKRRQEGVLWSVPRTAEVIRIKTLARILGSVPHSSRAAKSAVMRLGTLNDLQKMQGEAVFTPAAVIQEIRNPTTINPIVDLKISLSEILNKALSKRYRWREIDEKSPQFFTPFHGERAHTLAKALQAAETDSDIKRILQNQIDIYENPKKRTALPAIKDTTVATRLAADFKRHPFKGIHGYYDMLNHLMKLVAKHETLSLRAVRSNPDDVSKNADHNVTPQHQSWIASHGSQ